MILIKNTRRQNRNGIEWGKQSSFIQKNVEDVIELESHYFATAK